MRKEDLMIGDWVNIQTEKDDEPMYSQVEQLWECEIDADFQTDYKNVHPISLTSEILEKNSFLKVEAINYPSAGVGVSFLYRNTPEGLRILVQNACVGGPTCTMIKTCKYVHEVQHMIKMCDIERTFVL